MNLNTFLEKILSSKKYQKHENVNVPWKLLDNFFCCLCRQISFLNEDCLLCSKSFSSFSLFYFSRFFLSLKFCCFEYENWSSFGIWVWKPWLTWNFSPRHTASRHECNDRSDERSFESIDYIIFCIHIRVYMATDNNNCRSNDQISQTLTSVRFDNTVCFCEFFLFILPATLFLFFIFFFNSIISWFLRMIGSFIFILLISFVLLLNIVLIVVDLFQDWRNAIITKPTNTTTHILSHWIASKMHNQLDSMPVSRFTQSDNETRTSFYRQPTSSLAIKISCMNLVSLGFNNFETNFLNSGHRIDTVPCLPSPAGAPNHISNLRHHLMQ